MHNYMQATLSKTLILVLNIVHVVHSINITQSLNINMDTLK